MTLLGNFAIPLCGFGMILGNTPAVIVHTSEPGLGLSVTLLGGLTKLLYRFGITPGNSIAVEVHLAQVVLGLCKTLLGIGQKL